MINLEAFSCLASHSVNYKGKAHRAYHPPLQDRTHRDEARFCRPKPSARKDFHGQRDPPKSSSALDDVGPDLYRYRHAGHAAVSLAGPAGKQYPCLA